MSGNIMDKLAIHLALHGTLVLTISLFGGLFLYRAILKNNKEARSLSDYPNVALVTY